MLKIETMHLQLVGTVFSVLLFYCILPFVNVQKIRTSETRCGISNNKVVPSPRVVGGYIVGYYKYPWYAVLYSDESIICGGTLIGPETVLTAAHCFKPFLTDLVTRKVKLEDIFVIKLGVYDRCKNESSQKMFHAKRIVIHDNYFDQQPYYDIAVIKLKEKTSNYLPACLPQQVIQSSIRPKEGFIQGFGRLDHDNPQLPCALQEARVLIYSDSDCIKMLNSTSNNGNDLKHAFCAGYMNGGIDSCQGDSGGPLIVLDENGRYVLQGIISFGFGCAQKGVLGVYTDVSQYLKWLQNTTDLNVKEINDDNLNQIVSTNSVEPTVLTSKVSPSVVVVLLPSRRIWRRRRRLHRKHFRDMIRKEME